MASTRAGDINAQEIKELKRVFAHLANYVPRAKLQRALAPKQARLAELQAFLAKPDAVKPPVGATRPEEAELELNEPSTGLVRQVRDLQTKLAALDSAGTVKVITKGDLAAALRSLGKVCTKQEIDDMIWEADDDLDDAINWPEFRTMFQRNITDDSGLEPCALFNVVQFMTYDKKNSGVVTVDDTMSMLYARHPSADDLKQAMEKLFGPAAMAADGGGSLTFAEYLVQVSKNRGKPPSKEPIDYSKFVKGKG